MVIQPNQVPRSIHLLPDEKTGRLILIRRSRVFLIRKLLLPVLLLVLALTVALHGTISGSIAIGASVIVLALLVWMVSIYIDYRYSNICLLTIHRIIDIKRKHLLIRETRKETEYDNIREVRVDIANLFERLFRIGTVDIEMLSRLSSSRLSSSTPPDADDPDIRLSDVDRPLDIQNEIYKLRDQFEQEEYGQYGIEQRLVQDLLAAIVAQTKTGAAQAKTGP